jgi:ABC-type nitrate/sulfonate/bicarbonate transport system substrate-binding protein
MNHFHGADGMRRRQFLGVFGAVAAGGLLAACGDSDSSDASTASDGTTVLKVAPAVVQYYIAKERGYFAKRGMSLKLTNTFIAAPTLLPSLGKQYDLGLATLPDALNGWAGGVKTKIVFVDTSENTKYPQSFLVAKKSITTLKELKGRTIGVIAASGSLYVALLYQLHKVGVEASDIRWVNMPASTMSDQLKGGRIDAAVIPVLDAQPVLGDAGEFRTLGRPVIDAGGGSGMGTVLVANAAWAAKNASLLDDFRAAIVEATLWINAHPKETGQAYVKYMGMSEDTVKAATAAQILDNALGLQATEDRVQSWITIMEELGMLAKDKVTASDVLLPWPDGLSVAKPTDAQLNAGVG